MELVYVSLVSGVFSLIGIYLFYTLQTRKMSLDQDYKIKRFKLGNKYKLKKTEMPEQTTNPTLSDRAIKGVIDRYLSGRDEDLQDLDEAPGGITGILTDIIENNPELVKEYAPQLIDRFLKPKDKEEKRYL